MKRPENIDDLMRKGLQDSADSRPDIGIDESAWDIPSEGVWNEINRRLNPSRRRRRALLWIIGGFLLISLAAALFLVKPDANDALEDMKPDANNEMASVQPQHANGADEPGQFRQDSDLPRPSAGQKSTQIPSSRTDPDATQSHEQPADVTTNIVRPDASSAPTPIQNPVVSESPDGGPARGILHDRIRTAEPPEPLVSGPYSLATVSTIPVVVSSGPIVPVRDKSSWSVTLAMSPSFGTRDIQVPASHPRVRRDLLLQHEDPAMQFGFRLNISRDLSARWSVGTGIDYSRYLLRSTSLYQLRYTRAGEVRNSRGNFENRFSLNLNTSFGEGNTDVVVERSSDAMINENQFIDLTLKARQSMQVLQLPAVLQYRMPLGPLKLSVRGGPAVNILLENKLELSAVRSLNTDIIQTRAMRSVKLTGSRDIALGYQLGAELELPLERQWSVVFAPDLSGYLQPVYRDRHVLIYPHVFGVFFGMKYKFK